MIHSLRKLLSTKDRILAVAAAGSAMLYATSTGRSKWTVVGSIPTTIRESLLLPWKPKQWDQCPFGMLPMYCFSDVLVEDGSVSQLDTKKEDASGVTIAGERPERTYATAFAKVGPAVVHIHAPSRGHCAGTIIDKDGIVLTCAHAFVDLGLGTLVDSYECKVYITLQDGRRLEGTVVNLDVHSDIAIIKVDSDTPLPSAELGCSSKVQPGECVIAVGSPLSFKHTVTAGIVSCAARKNSEMRQDGWREYKEYIQTDCSINPGNSGGPLVNMDGEVIAINVRMIRAADGLNFAVPIDSVTKVMDQFKKNGRVVRPWLGVKMIELNDMIISQLEERGSAFPNVKKGILVPMVTPRSPGERAGFRPGDVVSKFDGRTVKTVKEIIEIVGDRVGEPLKVVVKRVNDEQVILTVIPEESSDPDM
ncbi:PREDICTED: putative protease Do-like 14 [Fragaria vesca subsp. vesca]|uniref:putative protease Do-like 14 n=1 Tax=Fragaria vesca subsp. vesca TaxID=101020 RepID=UPI0002C315F4|nr:PREDICTED: putative protease Do-like 14 [Fragaria vesca subsp. vesca]